MAFGSDHALPPHRRGAVAQTLESGPLRLRGTRTAKIFASRLRSAETQLARRLHQPALRALALQVMHDDLKRRGLTHIPDAADSLPTTLAAENPGSPAKLSWFLDSTRAPRRTEPPSSPRKMQTVLHQSVPRALETHLRRWHS
jgi:hypothetical protein